MNRNTFLTVIAAGALSTSVYAGTMGAVTPDNDWRWVGTVSMGPTWTDGGQTQTFYLAPGVIKTFKAKDNSQALVDGELFVGVQKGLPFDLQGQFGLAVALTSSASLSGNIWDDADPDFNNYTYNYQLQHMHVAAKGKLLMDKGYWVLPWISGSVGVGFNDAYGFTNAPLFFQAVPMNNFTSNTQTTFTYTVGAGIQKPLSTHWQVGAGYEFADWGQSHLGRAAGQTANKGLWMHHFYTNGAMFNLTYIG